MMSNVVRGKSRFLQVLCCVVAGIVISGCGASPQPFTDNSQDAEAFAKNVKQMIVNAADRLKASKEPEDDLRPIVDYLSDLESAPTGSYKQTYDELRTIASGLLTSVEEAGRKPGDFNAKLAALAKAAEALPGDVTVQRDSLED